MSPFYREGGNCMKRFYYILVCIVMMLSFAGCTAGSDKDDKEPVKQETQQETEKDENSEVGRIFPSG